MSIETTADSGSVYEPRLSSNSSAWIVLAWSALIVVLAAVSLTEYLDYFAERDPRFRWALAGLLVGLVLASWIYTHVRRSFLWRW